MTLVHVLPAINATLNAITGVLLITAYILIKQKRIALHRRFMIAACITALTFLACYVTNHYLRHGIVTRFTATGPIRLIYFTILISHTILAIAIVPLVIITLTRALRERYDRHRAIARWTYPLWLYVSVTGVIVYVMLYHLPRWVA